MNKYFVLGLTLLMSFNSYSQSQTITYSPSNTCPAGKTHLSPDDVRDNMAQLKGMLGQWQITQIGNNHVITGGGYGYEVKVGSAGDSFCVDGPKQLVDITYVNANTCPSSMIHLPESLVSGEMEQLEGMLGSWQITQIGNGKVITGGGYGYEVKAGHAGNSFCVRDTITLVKSEDIINFGNNPDSIVEKFGDFKHVIVPVSNDEAYVRNFSLPSVGVANHFEITLVKNTGYSVSLNGVEASRNGSVSYKFINSKWVRSNPYIVKHSDFDALKTEKYSGSREMYMQTLLNKQSFVSFSTRDGFWFSEVHLPSNALDGQKFEFSRFATYSTKIYFENQMIEPRINTQVSLTKVNGQWEVDYIY